MINDSSVTKDHMPSIVQVARLAGVSVATASRVLSNADYPVSAPMRLKVLDAAATLHYVPNPLARSLKGQPSHIMAVLVANSADPYFAEVTSGIIEEADKHGYLVMTCNTERLVEKELHYLRLVRDYRADCILYAGSGSNDPSELELERPLVQQLRRRGAAIVTLTQHLLPVPSLQPDNFNGARLMTHHLIGLGHRRIAFVGGPQELLVSTVRAQGYLTGLAEAGIEIDPAWFTRGNFTMDGGALAIQTLLQLPVSRRPTAIFAINDEMAFGILRTLRDAQIPVPGAISVCGFDNLPMAELVSPSLTSVQIPLRELGRRGARLALANLNGDTSVEPQLIPLEVIARASTAPPLVP